MLNLQPYLVAEIPFATDLCYSHAVRTLISKHFNY